LIKFIFFGITQGLTEFLPVSSSGHLYILKKLLNLEGNLFSFFVLLHLATLLAIAVVLHKEIRRALFNRKLLVHLGIITLITISLGFLIDSSLEWVFESKYFISFCLLVNAGILLSITKKHMKRDSQNIRLKDSIILGIVQAIAIFPGISRSGITIAALLRRGFHIKETFTFSFLMAIPVILGAFFSKYKYLFNSNSINGTQATIGFVAAFIFGLIALRIVRSTLLHHKFAYFGYYCLIVSLLGVLV